MLETLGDCCLILFFPIWPIISIAVGIVWGAIASTFATLIVLSIALVRFPLHLWQTFYFAATTQDCFKGIQGKLWRLPVLLLAPIGPILFVLVSTAACATIGTLKLIGDATRTVYSHEYAEAAKNTRSNLRFEEKSTLRQYWDACKEVVEDDSFASTTIECLKGALTLVFSLAFACLAFIPFSVTMTAITVYRLPINLFKTMKIALFTVMLRWDLRIIVLFMLPLIHTAFPVMVLVASMVGCFFWTWGQTHENLFEDKNPFRKWNQLVNTVRDYYEEHKKFVSKRCNRFDHPTGIPMGWNGQQYGLEIERLLRFQLNFLLCVALAVYQTPIILVGTTVILLIKFIPSCIHFWREYFEECISNTSCVIILSVWPFHILAIVLIPIGSFLFAICFILLALVWAYFDVTQFVFDDHAPICKCLSVPWIHIRKCDKWTAKHYVSDERFRLINKQCCPWHNAMIDDDDDDESGRHQYGNSSSTRETLNADVYWDRFASQCIQSTSELLANGFLDFDSVEGMDPSCVQSIPSVAVVTILMDSLQKQGLKRGDIYWKVDESVCEVKGRAPLDNISALLWPMVLDLYSF
ncbi:unnamed protein product [Cylindrotheca closterium]|uniref:Uncharacterized protein n=1 Tax=Cylindrotheca closterium TaxID=2856 RepID=A0AAD2PVK7_9STRA|nr:unnamed protein product [Cylindrotheca closterium]